MKLSQRAAFGTALAAITLTTLSPIAAKADGFNWGHGQSWNQAQNQQDNKNTWRNLTIGAGALAVAGLLDHNKTMTVVGALGAAYSADRYEQDRHNQSVDNSGRDYYRYDGRGYNRGSDGDYRDNDRGRDGDHRNRW